jgi:hypothetical protein
MPDYQGIGLGTLLLSQIAKIYSKKGFDFSIRTSAKNLIFSLRNKEEWLLQFYGITKSSNSKYALDYNRKSMRTKSKACTFFYKEIIK